MITFLFFNMSLTLDLVISFSNGKCDRGRIYMITLTFTELVPTMDLGFTYNFTELFIVQRTMEST